MVEAAEDPYTLLRDLRFLAVDWAAGLSCCLHRLQKRVGMAALGAVAAYRLEAKEGIAVPGLLDRWTFALDRTSSGCCAGNHASLDTKETAEECLAEKGGGSDVVSEKPIETPRLPEEKFNESGAVSEALLDAAKKPEESNAVSEGLLTGEWSSSGRSCVILRRRCFRLRTQS